MPKPQIELDEVRNAVVHALHPALSEEVGKLTPPRTEDLDTAAAPPPEGAQYVGDDVTICRRAWAVIPAGESRGYSRRAFDLAVVGCVKELEARTTLRGILCRFQRDVLGAVPPFTYQSTPAYFLLPGREDDLIRWQQGGIAV